jgi:hypothetical protein
MEGYPCSWHFGDTVTLCNMAGCVKVAHLVESLGMMEEPPTTPRAGGLSCGSGPDHLWALGAVLSFPGWTGLPSACSFPGGFNPSPGGRVPSPHPAVLQTLPSGGAVCGACPLSSHLSVNGSCGGTLEKAFWPPQLSGTTWLCCEPDCYLEAEPLSLHGQMPKGSHALSPATRVAFQTLPHLSLASP